MTNSDQDLYLRQWANGLRISHIAHSRTAAIFERRHRVLGVTAAVLSATVGTSIFTVLSDNPEGWVVGLVGAVSLLTAVVTSLVAFLDYGGRASRHTAAAQ